MTEICEFTKEMKGIKGQKRLWKSYGNVMGILGKYHGIVSTGLYNR